ncbi:MAG: class I SAM-dependent methyltransferase [Bacteroidetes bacterium]|nr:MAG: class I SAM-dependent methyltransferase [Bacteroidota bacterium]
MKLYNQLAQWWPLLSAPEDYEEEANLFRGLFSKHKKDIRTMLELGSGGGNNAFFLKQHYQLTLTDLSPQMIEVSKKLNPECEHFVGDMRYLDLNKTFDAVFIHDAIMYMTNERDLSEVFANAHRHLNKNGMLLIVPDFFKETFQPSTDHGGHDGQQGSMRYLEWTYDSDETDNIVETQYLYILRDSTGLIRKESDSSIEGIFPMATWESLLKNCGFTVQFEPMEHSELESGTYFGIVAHKI